MDVDLSKIPNYSKIRAKDWKQRSRQVYPIDTIFELEDDRYVIWLCHLQSVGVWIINWSDTIFGDNNQ